MTGPGIAKAAPAVDEVVAHLRLCGFLEVVLAVATEHRLPMELLCGRSRSAAAVRVRHAAWEALRAHGLSSPEIGALFGFNHTTVLYATGTLSRRKPRGWARRQEAKAS